MKATRCSLVYFRLNILKCYCAGTLLLFLLIKDSVGDQPSAANSPQEIVELNEDNWQLMLNGEWMVEFFAPWCPACRNLAPTWERFASIANNVQVKVAKIDVTTSPSLSGRFFVTALPTIYHVVNGEFRQYRGSRDGDALLYFVKQQQWKNMQPISAWKKPNTIHMSILSYFFKLSHILKDFNGRLQQEYGLPSWGSYAVFAIATIFVGAALGLILVCIVDLLYPPKKYQRQSFSESKEKKEGIEANDEIEDDAPIRPKICGVENDIVENQNRSKGKSDKNNDDDGDYIEGSCASDNDKLTSSESECPEGKKKLKISETSKNNPSLNSIEVRKRKPRKAD